MKVAMLSEHASPLAVIGGADAGGQNIHVAALGHALAARGHDVTVYTRRDCPSTPQRVQLGRRFAVEQLDAGPAEAVPKDDMLPFVPALAEALTRRLGADRPAVVHAHFWMSGLAACTAGSRLELPVIQTFHALGAVKRRMQGTADTSPAERIDYERQLLREVDRVVASCTDEVRELITLGARRPRVDIVPSGVDTAHFTPEGPRARRGTRSRLLVVGRLVRRKGTEDAIEALGFLPDAELVIAGGPPRCALDRDPEAVRLAELARQIGVRDRVRFLGQVPHERLPALFRSADLVLCLPWYEPFGIVPLEAMACGVPVVGTAVGGLVDTVVDGVTGSLLPIRSPELVAEVAGQLLADPALRRRLGAAGARRVHRHYQWSEVARGTERTYLLALENSAERTVAAGAREAG